MAKIYANRIKAGKFAIEDVPARWRKATEELLAAEESENEEGE